MDEAISPEFNKAEPEVAHSNVSNDMFIIDSPDDFGRSDSASSQEVEQNFSKSAHSVIAEKE